MKVNLENFVFCYWGLKGLRTPPPLLPPIGKTRNIIVTE